VPARPEVGAAAAVQLPRPPPPEGDQRPGATPLPQESVQLPGALFSQYSGQCTKLMCWHDAELSPCPLLCSCVWQWLPAPRAALLNSKPYLPPCPVGPGGMDQGLFANLAAFVAISPSLGLLSERLQLKRVVPVAVDRAICEVRGCMICTKNVQTPSTPRTKPLSCPLVH
jgi:hypothetical protein